MADFRLPYGKKYLSLRLPDDRQAEWIAPVAVQAAPDPVRQVEAALGDALGGVRLRDFADARSVAVAVSDKTRPSPSVIITALLAELEAMGWSPGAITLWIATGTHTPMQPAEFSTILPDSILSRYTVRSHDCDQRASLVYLGDTPRGTPVWANRHFVETDLRIVVGNLEPHQFMGFSGGVKSAAIGLTGRETINRNHALMRDPQARLGHYETNPARQDVEDIGRLIGVHFALNAILNRDKQLVQALAGDPVEVMQAGIPLVRHLYEVGVPAPYDLVIASPGGHPKDINLYQSQKALAHAALVTSDGGTVIMVAACSEGTGSVSYEQWMVGMTSPKDVLERFAREEFCLGPHKAFQIARDAVRVRAVLVSEMSPESVQHLLLTPAETLDQAVTSVLSQLGQAARIGVMPAANATIPCVRAGCDRPVQD